jgi:hypothetical protein
VVLPEDHRATTDWQDEPRAADPPTRAAREKVLYIQIPDSDPAGLVSSARDFMAMFGITTDLPTSLRTLATPLGALAEAGWVIALEEFQYSNRKALYEFTSQLQAEVDRLAVR